MTSEKIIASYDEVCDQQSAAILTVSSRQTADALFHVLSHLRAWSWVNTLLGYGQRRPRDDVCNGISQFVNRGRCVCIRMSVPLNHRPATLPRMFVMFVVEGVRRWRANERIPIEAERDLSWIKSSKACDDGDGTACTNKSRYPHITRLQLNFPTYNWLLRTLKVATISAIHAVVAKLLCSHDCCGLRRPTEEPSIGGCSVTTATAVWISENSTKFWWMNVPCWILFRIGVY